MSKNTTALVNIDNRTSPYPSLIQPRTSKSPRLCQNISWGQFYSKQMLMVDNRQPIPLGKRTESECRYGLIEKSGLAFGFERFHEVMVAYYCSQQIKKS